MKPTEEQLEDPKWWDENVHPETERIYVGNHCLYAMKLEGAPKYRASGTWFKFMSNVDAQRYWSYAKPRPAKPPAPERDGEFPKMAIMVNPHEATLHYGEDHLGKEIEVVEHLPDESCYVVRFDWGLGVLHESMIDFGLYKLRTKEQREREELASIVVHGMQKGMTSNEIADAILSRYEVKERNQ